MGLQTSISVTISAPSRSQKNIQCQTLLMVDSTSFSFYSDQDWSSDSYHTVRENLSSQCSIATRITAMNDNEESAPLLDLDQQPNTRPSFDNPTMDDDGSSKESNPRSPLTAAPPQPVTPSSPHIMHLDHGSEIQELPAPVTHPQERRPKGMVEHVALLLPRFTLAMLWFSLYMTFIGGSIAYLCCWLLVQLFTGFTRASVDKKMLRRDLGGFFDTLLDLFERIW